MINLTEKDKEGLQRILEYEDTTDRDREHFSQFGWTWDTVRVWPATLNRLIQMGLLEVVSHSNSYRGMKLTLEGYAVVRNLGNPQDAEDEALAIPDSLPEDIFQDIVGHEKIKKIAEGCCPCCKAGACASLGTAGASKEPVPLGTGEGVG
ncbi:hypothetical protein M1N92_00370 [Dehalococcoidia bacterium]|nr:hypothetical protein [Dehalococcoidia bacterium]